jgi:hypothetical protein
MTTWAEMGALIGKYSEETKTPQDKVLQILILDEERREKEEAERQASPEELDKIKHGVPELYNGNPNLELTNEEICTKLGVRFNRGTSQSIQRQQKKYLLTHRKAAE